MDPTALNTGMAGVYLIFAFIVVSLFCFIRRFMK
jgi:hypothetical protein